MRICFSLRFSEEMISLVKRYSQATRDVIKNGSVERVLEERNLQWVSDILINNIVLD